MAEMKFKIINPKVELIRQVRELFGIEPTDPPHPIFDRIKWIRDLWCYVYGVEGNSIEQPIYEVDERNIQTVMKLVAEFDNEDFARLQALCLGIRTTDRAEFEKVLQKELGYACCRLSGYSLIIADSGKAEYYKTLWKVAWRKHYGEGYDEEWEFPDEEVSKRANEILTDLLEREPRVREPSATKMIARKMWYWTSIFCDLVNKAARCKTQWDFVVINTCITCTCRQISSYAVMYSLLHHPDELRYDNEYV